jgi:site-specific DNA-adenine methylase
MKMKEKMYTSAPLPFQGQKRRHVKEFGKIVDRFPAAVYVDLFGGSGLLSHVAKRHSPRARVVYNDYDDYRARLSNTAKTNALLADLRPILASCPRDKRVDTITRETIIRRLEKETREGYPVDWITVSSSLLFSMNHALSLDELASQSFYNTIRANDYVSDGYLDGLEVVRCDYRELFRQYKETPGAIFIVDPPYLSTDVKTYGSGEYWKLGDYLDVLNILDEINYVYFTSCKSNIIELAGWMGMNLHARDPFAGATRRELFTYARGNVGYTDIMLYKIDTPPRC